MVKMIGVKLFNKIFAIVQLFRHTALCKESPAYELIISENIFTNNFQYDKVIISLPSITFTVIILQVNFYGSVSQ